MSATAAWATRTDCASLPPITCALAPHVETEARANSPASTITSVNAHQAGQVKTASKLILVPQILVPTAVSVVPLILTTFATAHPSSQAKPANKTSMSAPRVPLLARTVACVRTRWARIVATALRSTPGNTVRPSISPVTPHHATTGAPAYRRERRATSAPVCQALVVRTARRTLMTVQTIAALTEGPVWME